MSLSTNLDKERRKSVQIAEMENLTAIAQVTECTFDLENHGWKGRVTGPVDTLKITRRVKDKKEMMASQDKDRLRHFKRLISVEEPNVAEDSEDTASICMDPSEVPLEIEQPFVDVLTPTDVTWLKPEEICSPLKDRLQWSKPNESATKTVLSSSIRLHQMEELVAKKDAEIEILRHHLMKAHRTNDLLVKQLDNCTVPDIDSILSQNVSLKSYVARMSRENAVLRGLRNRQLNTRLQTFERVVTAAASRDKRKPYSEDEHARALKIVIRANNQKEGSGEQGDSYSGGWSTNS
ncbi:hypothetical protein LSAT2_014656 [Lamellibrachia satsuma]|nr:hypothetical protein LSAT2_014656 [Lamellibrachia satsuma]